MISMFIAPNFTTAELSLIAAAGMMATGANAVTLHAATAIMADMRLPVKGVESNAWLHHSPLTATEIPIRLEIDLDIDV